MKFNDVTRTYFQKFKALLERGVTIKIFYGFRDKNGEPDKDTEQIAGELKKRFHAYSNFKMKWEPLHAKIFICDDKFTVLSSYNLLSKYGGNNNSGEGFGEAGLLSNDTKLIAHHRKEYFDF